MNEIPVKTNEYSNDPVFSINTDAMGNPHSKAIPMPNADSPNALVNLDSPSNFTNIMGRRAVKNAAEEEVVRKKRSCEWRKLVTNTKTEDDAVTNLNDGTVCAVI